MKSASLITGILLFLFFSCSLNSDSASSPPRRNVLLISIDTLRPDHLGCYGYKASTPAIDALAAKSVLFENAISQVPLTLPSHSTILTGLFPDRHGVRNNENFVLDPKIKTLAEHFRKNGYETGAVVGSFSLDSSFGLDQGFQFYEDEMGQGPDDSVNRYVERRAEKVAKIGQTWMNNRRGSWFCFLHFFDPHTGYNPPAPFPQNYDGEIAYVDRVIGSLLQNLSQASKLSNTVVVLLSDHGESLGEHGESSHGVFLYDATLKVPLLVQAPELAAGKIKSQVRLADVAPTIVELAGLNLKEFATSGQSLLSQIQGSQTDLPAYSETYYTNLLMGWASLHSVRMDRKKFIEAPKPEYYDLSADPRESKNLIISEKVPQALKQELQKHHTQQQVVSSGRTPDPETREKLASLGYVSGGSSKSVQSSFDPKDGIEIWILIEEAVQLAQTGKLDQSSAKLYEVLKKQPENVMAETILGNVLVKKGNLDEAARHFKKALRSNLAGQETRYDLAEVFYERKQYSEALEQLHKLLEQDTSNMRALKLAAFCYLQLKDYKQAASTIEKVLIKYPNDALSLSHYARVLSFLQRDQEALKAYKKLSEVRPLNEEEAIQVAAIYLTVNNITAAEQYFQKAVQANPKSSQAWRGLGLIQVSKREFLQALDAFLKAGDCNGARQVVFQDRTLPRDKVSEFEQMCKAN